MGQEEQKIGRICVFGDSLQDNGNIAKVLGFPLAPFDGGRFCDGPVANEYLRDSIEARQKSEVSLLNYAIGGALTSGKNPKSLLTDQAFPVGDQLDRFVSQEHRFKSDDLISLNTGGNNFLFAIHDESPYINVSAIYRVADDLFQHTNRVIALGARKIILWNVPDVTITPAYDVAPFPKWFAKYYKKFIKRNIQKQNTKLQDYALELKRKYPYVQIEVLDAFNLMDDVLEDPMAHGFANATDPCVKSFGGVDDKGNIQHDLEILGDPTTHLFWDYVHPTSKGQKMIADEMYASLYALDKE